MSFKFASGHISNHFNAIQQLPWGSDVPWQAPSSYRRTSHHHRCGPENAPRTNEIYLKANMPYEKLTETP